MSNRGQPETPIAATSQDDEQGQSRAAKMYAENDEGQQDAAAIKVTREEYRRW
jgi:hypothetical protein